MKATANYFKIQCDQLHHLLEGGTLTKAQVEKSGLGEGVLIEQRHLAHRLKVETYAHGQTEGARNRLARRVRLMEETLDSISKIPRSRRASSLARSTLTFIREMEKERMKRNP